MRSWPDHNITDNSRLKNVSFFLAVPLIFFTFSFVQEPVAQDAKNQYKKKELCATCCSTSLELNWAPVAVQNWQPRINIMQMRS